MKEKIKVSAENALSELMTKSIEAAERGSEFLGDQIPLVIEELLKWKMAESLSYNAISIACFVIIILMSRFVYKVQAPWIGRGKFSDSRELSYIITGIAYIFPITCMFMFSNIEFLKIWLAPRVYLIEYSASLVK